MRNNHKKIFWILGRRDLMKSGVGLYSLCFIGELQKRGWIVKFSKISNSRAMEWLYRLTLLPIEIFTKVLMGYQIVAKDESYAFLAPISLNKMIIILHHLRRNDRLLVENSKLRLLADDLFKIFATRIKKIVVVSDYCLKGLLKEKPDLNKNAITIHNSITGFSSKIFDSERMKLFEKFNISKESGLKYLLYVGCEAPRKNFKTLLFALSKLKNKNIKLLKLGLSFFEENHLEHLQIIKDLELEDQVHFLGEVKLEELNSFYHSADILILPSEFEGFGRTPVEAQACGCPVISTHGGALEEVVGNSCMIVKDPLNVDEWVEKINLMLNCSQEKKEEWIRKGYENAKRFDIEHLTDLWEKVLSE